MTNRETNRSVEKKKDRPCGPRTLGRRENIVLRYKETKTLKGIWKGDTDRVLKRGRFKLSYVFYNSRDG